MLRNNTLKLPATISKEKKARVSETPDYDPRYDRAQTVAGAKARYADPNAPKYDLAALERDLERLLTEGDLPDGYQGGRRVATGISRSRYEKQCPTCGEWGPQAPCADCQTDPEAILGATEVR
jgi:hypothetical protein